MNINQVNNLILAYLGDSVYELKIRTYLINLGINNVNKIQNKSLEYITAKKQSEIVKKMIDENIFTEEEIVIIKRGRNSKVNSHPKNIDIISYKWATALETLFGYLYLMNNFDRIDELIKYIVGDL